MENADLVTEMTVRDQRSHHGGRVGPGAAGRATTSSMLDLVIGLLLESGNDAANAIALTVSGGRARFCGEDERRRPRSWG